MLERDDLLAALGECGMWDCIEFHEWDDSFELHLTDLQLVAAAAITASAADSILNPVIDVVAL